MSKQKEILKSRAEKLARVSHVEEPSERIKVLVFQLENERYAIEMIYVKEVFPLKDYTPIPCVPPFIFGLANIRRKILSIFDLKAFFELTHKNKGTKLIIVEENEMELALLADEIYEIQLIKLKDIHPLPSLFLSTVKQDFLQGIAPNNVIIIDGKKLLSSKQIVIEEPVEI